MKPPFFNLLQAIRSTRMTFTIGYLILGTLTPEISHANPQNPAPKTCVHIASYTPGYVWQDGIDRGLQTSLNNGCQLDTFYMNSKTVIDEHQLKSLGEKAKLFIENKQPDVVIISDDNAVKYLLQPFFRNSKLPFVFCALNNSGQQYGLPYPNTTGMIEVSPIKTFLEHLLHRQFSQPHIAMLTTQGTTSTKDLIAFTRIAEELNIKITTHQAVNQQDWRVAYQRFQNDPSINIIALGNLASFSQWDHKKNVRWVKKHNQKLTIATHVWVLPFAAIGMTKSAVEQGEWAGKAALEILNGRPIDQLSVVPNHRFETWINPELIKPFQTQIPSNILKQALNYE